ncbi:hypothetical protein ACP70R_012883 [Stipagrostis hirtigluma subsp. patula]
MRGAVAMAVVVVAGAVMATGEGGGHRTGRSAVFT